jgi:hypothetical protein
MKESSENPNKNDHVESLRRAQLLHKNYGYVEVDRIFTNAREANAGFAQVIGGQILNCTGSQFYWKRPPAQDLILYARNTCNQELNALGLVELCRIKKMPDQWVGVGRFGIDWPYRKKEDKEPIHQSVFLFD